MNILNIESVKTYVNENIGDFHNRRISCLDSLELLEVIRRKNPYLFKAKNILTSEGIIRGIVDAYISSNEETIFGDWLEGLAIFINGEVYNGWKSGIPGIDLEFDNDGIRYIVNIKSGPNWANKSQIAKLKLDFISAKKTLRTSNSKINVIAVNGCCYGRDRHPDKGEYYKYCGQEFWKFISGNENLYIDIIEPLSYNAKQKNDEYNILYSALINRFTIEFSSLFCKTNGEIEWDRIVQYNSSIKGLKIKKISKKDN
ncbi:MAG: PmeII family type II restriction endonuclease [Smithella sp.]|nr:PmeII family type II restriction endonuclease [Smithella sp.]